MKHRLYWFFAFFIITALLISGCAQEHRAGPFAITTPGYNSTFSTTDHITITLHRYSPIDPYHYFRYQIRDNGNSLINGESGSAQSDIQHILNGGSIGSHKIDARAQAFDSANSHSNWYQATEICIYIGPNPPSNFTCNNYAWPQNLEFILTPAFPRLIIVTESPPVTPIIIIRPNNNSGGGKTGGGNNPGGATGCAAYGDKTSCDLAGCSWNGSSCTVSP